MKKTFPFVIIAILLAGASLFFRYNIQIVNFHDAQSENSTAYLIRLDRLTGSVSTAKLLNDSYFMPSPNAWIPVRTWNPPTAEEFLNADNPFTNSTPTNRGVEFLPAEPK